MLVMSPFGDTLRNRIRMFPNIVNCTTIIWYREWPDEGLQAVAQKMISGMEIEANTSRNLVQVCKFFHKNVKEISDLYKKAEGR